MCNIDNYQLMQRRRHNDIIRKATFIITAVIMKQCKELNLPWVYLTILCPSLPLHCNTFSLLSTEFSICMLSILGQSLSATTLLLIVCANFKCSNTTQSRVLIMTVSVVKDCCCTLDLQHSDDCFISDGPNDDYWTLRTNSQYQGSFTTLSLNFHSLL